MKDEEGAGERESGRAGERESGRAGELRIAIDQLSSEVKILRYFHFPFSI
jgi:hypothetical protein